MLKKFSLQTDRALNSLKTAIACIAGIIISKYFHMTMGLWMVVTILVLMDSKLRFGAALKASYMRIVGTILGALVACLTLATLGDDLLIDSVVIFFSVLLFSYIASSVGNFSTAGSLGSITLTSILLAKDPTIDYGILRLLEILSGIGVALLVSKIIFPIHARELLLKDFADTFRNFCELYIVMHEKMPIQQKLPKVQKLEETIVSSYSGKGQLIGEAKAEWSNIAFNKPIAESILNYQRRLFRSLILMYQAINKEPEKYEIIAKLPKLKEFNRQVQASLSNLADALENTASLQPLDTLNNSLKEFEEKVKAKREKIPVDVVINIDTLLFCARHMVDEINVLQILVGNYKTL